MRPLVLSLLLALGCSRGAMESTGGDAGVMDAGPETEPAPASREPAEACVALRDALVDRATRCGREADAAAIEDALTGGHGCEAVTGLRDLEQLEACLGLLEEASCEDAARGTPAVCRDQLAHPARCTPLELVFPEDGAVLDGLLPLEDGNLRLEARVRACGVEEGAAATLELMRSDGARWSAEGRLEDGEAWVPAAVGPGLLELRARVGEEEASASALVLPPCGDGDLWLRLSGPFDGEAVASPVPVRWRRCGFDEAVRLVAVDEDGREVAVAMGGGSAVDLELPPGPIWLRAEGGGTRSPQVAITVAEVSP